MSGTLRNVEALVDGNIELPPLTKEQRLAITASIAAIASADALGLETVEVPPQQSAAENWWQSAA